MVSSFVSPYLLFDAPPHRNDHAYLRWKHLGELWAEDQFGCPDGRARALDRLSAQLMRARVRPDQAGWAILVHAFEARWGAIRRDWLNRSETVGPHLRRALLLALSAEGPCHR
jgi:hypothetical protein